MGYSFSLQRLAELTPKLPEITTIPPPNARGMGSLVQYRTVDDVGECTAVGLLHTDDVAVCWAWMPAGSEIFPHSHEVTEHGVVVKGRFLVRVSAGEYEVKSGGHLVFIPGERHSVLAVEDTEMVFITIPAEKGYPYAANQPTHPGPAGRRRME